MPGIQIVTSVRSGPSATPGSDDATFLVAGVTERGPLTALFVHSLGEYIASYGDRVTYGALYDQVRTYFEEGGIRCGVSRVVGPAAAVGTLTLKDRAGAGGVNTVRIDAKDPGAWSTRVTVQVADGVTNTTTISVFYDGVVQEVFANLASPAAIAAALTTSKYVRATDLGSVTAAPGNNPVVLAATALSAGNDDRGSIVAATYVAALEDFDDDLFGPGLVAIPGQPISTVGAGIMAHCVAHNRVGLTAVAIGTSVSAAKTAVNTLQLATNTPGLEYMGLAYPGVVIPDAGGITRTITPEGYVAACRARAIVQEGVWRAPMGAIAAAKFVTGQEIPIDQVTGDGLDTAFISAIRQIAGVTTLYGWRSLSVDTANYHLLKDRDLLNSIEIECKAALQAYVGVTIDASRRELSRAKGDLIGIVEPIANLGGLFAGSDDPGYSVDVSDAAGNTIQNLSMGKIGAVVAVRPSPTAELITLTVVRVALTANV